MDNFKISIVKQGTSPNYFVFTNRGRDYLFRFHQSSTDSKVWYFVMPEAEDRSLFVVSDEFPVNHLLKFAEAFITIRYCTVDFNLQLTNASKKLLGIK